MYDVIFKFENKDHFDKMVKEFTQDVTLPVGMTVEKHDDATVILNVSKEADL
jgi:hypothetical protein